MENLKQSICKHLTEDEMKELSFDKLFPQAISGETGMVMTCMAMLDVGKTVLQDSIPEHDLYLQGRFHKYLDVLQSLMLEDDYPTYYATLLATEYVGNERVMNCKLNNIVTTESFVRLCTHKPFLDEIKLRELSINEVLTFSDNAKIEENKDNFLRPVQFLTDYLNS